MISIRSDQHAKILGFALIGYGLQFSFVFLEFFHNVWLEFSNPYSQIGFLKIISHFLNDQYGAVLFTVVSVLAGLSLLSVRSKFKLPCILFALAAISFFPLGSILSIYTLFYLFVIKENENEIDFPAIYAEKQ